VTKGWWNKEWLARVLGAIQALKGPGADIEIGSGRRAVLVSCTPLQWDCPIAIDVEAMARFEDFQREMAQMRYADAEDDGESDGPSSTDTDSLEDPSGGCCVPLSR
jgi:hypothetical protein